MIFVIIGVVILVISFIIALQSLVKEQNKAKILEDSQKLSGEKDEDATDKGEKKEVKDVVESVPDQTRKPRIGEEEARVQTGREPFFWEKDFQISQKLLLQLFPIIADLLFRESNF